MDPLCKFELVDSELLDIEPKVALLIEKVRWGEFFRSFDGHNVEVTGRFSLSFKENFANIRDL